MPASGGEKVTLTSATKGTFGEIEYALSDAGKTYEYTISETTGFGDGWTASADVTATVTVTDKKDGTLGFTVEYTNNDTITNDYSTSGEAEIQVKKNLTGREWTTDDSFEFTITPVGDAPAFDPNTATVTNKSVDYTESFGTVTFTEPGTYAYTVREKHKGETIDGIAYDKDDKTVTIVVVDDKKGHLVPAEGSSLLQIAEFNNPYSASGDGEILVEKVLIGRDWDNDDVFTVTVSAEEGTPMPETTSVEITKDSDSYTESFGPIHFTEAGEYTYTVKETKGNIKGVIYDETEYTVTIETVDDGKGNIVAAEGCEMIQVVTVTNIYIDIKVKKVDDKKEPVKGAVLAVKDEDGNIVDQWTTDGTPHEVENLLPNTKYILTELKVPEGYDKSPDMTFTTNDVAKAQVLEMVDKKTVIPDTSDHNRTPGWTISMIMSLLMAGLAFATRKKYGHIN